MRTQSLALIFALAGSIPAFGQTPPPAPPAASSRIWRAGFGYETLWIRDVSRYGRPVDASPIFWEAAGPALDVQYDRLTPRSLHRFQFNASWTGDADLRSPLRTIPLSADEKAAQLTGGYEYRRYPFRDLGADGLDVGVGLATGAVFRTLTHVYDPAIEVRDRGTDFTLGVVAAGRFRRWQAFQAEIAWANGLAVGKTTTSHSIAVEETVSGWGGGWITDLTIRGDVRLSAAVTAFVSFFTTGRVRTQSHAASASGRNQLIAGVVYGR